MNKYLGAWDCKNDIWNDFFPSYVNKSVPNNDYEDGVEIILACYHPADYSGSAFVLFKKDEKLYEVHGSHCSCMGLEEQWNPEETTIEALEHRLQHGNEFNLNGMNIQYALVEAVNALKLDEMKEKN